MNCGGFLTAVVLRVIVETELEAVVGAANQLSGTASVAVMGSSVIRAVTVSLPLLARILWSAAPPLSVVPPGTPLVCRRLQGHRAAHRGGDCPLRLLSCDASRTRLHTAIIFCVEERSELFAVVVTTDETSSTVAIYLAISLAFGAGILRGTAWSGEEISSLACSRGEGRGNWFWFDAAIIFFVEERSKLFAVVVTTDKTSSTVAISLAISMSF